MMNDDMLRNIEYLREKADVSYEEAATLLERYDGNVMRVLVELERQGRIYQQGHPGYEAPKAAPKAPKSENKEKANSFLNNVLSYRLKVEKTKGDEKETVANLSAPYVAGAAIVAPHLAVASVALMFVMGYRVKLKKEKTEVKMPGDVEEFVDKTVNNVKQTVSSFTESVRGERKEDAAKRDDNDDNDEGGEITVE